MEIKKTYFSMPISGYEIDERIRTAALAKQTYENEHRKIITPFDAIKYDPDRSYGECMKACIKELIDCDDVMFAPNWYESNGCRIEAEIARGCEMKMTFL